MKLRNLALPLMLTAALTAGAVPARREVRTVEQPDGSTLQIRKVGDEHFHYTTTLDGVPVMRTSEGYNFARLNIDGTLTNTGVRAADLGKRDAAQQRVAIAPDKATLTKAVAARNAKKRGNRRHSAAKIAQSGMGTFTTTFPNKGDVKVLVILVDYSDVKFSTPNAHQYFTDMCNKQGFSEYNATGSAYDYFIDQSNGEFHPQFDVYGPVQLPKNRKYYGGNDDWFGEDEHPEEMVIDAIKLLDPTVDFSQYDNDKNGTLDNVYIFYAGEGEASSYEEDAVWPHSWELSDAGSSFTVDGVLVDKYACSNEWDTASEPAKPDGIGTLVHEFSHVMGLPDLYNTTYEGDTNYTPGSWSIMDYGSYNNDSRTPPNYSIYERNAMQWIEPELLEEPAKCELEHIATSNMGYIIPTERTNEFFLLENRQQTGWDEYIPYHGLLIWHIDFDQDVFDANEVNNDTNHPYVTLVKANNVHCASTKEDYWGETYYDWDEEKAAGWAYPGTANKTAFTAETLPAMKSWNNREIDMPITEIAEKNGVISFLAAGGVAAVATPANLAATNISSDSFDLSWDAVEEADDYIVEVLVGAGGETKTVTADMGSGKTVTLPSGWESNSTDNYSSAGNYGEAIPSLAFKKDAKYLITEEMPANIKKISFWYKGMTVSGNSALLLQRKNGNDWETFQTITPTNDAENVTITSIPAGTRQVRFYYSKDKGNVGIDDIKIECGEDATPLDGFAEVKTGGKTSIHVSPLAEGKTEYEVSVRAVKGEDVSRKAKLNVTTVDTGIFCVTEVADNISIEVNGNTIIINADEAVSVFDIAGRRVAFAENGKGEFTLPAGIYIAAGKKIIIR